MLKGVKCLNPLVAMPPPVSPSPRRHLFQFLLERRLTRRLINYYMPFSAEIINKRNLWYCINILDRLLYGSAQRLSKASCKSALKIVGPEPQITFRFDEPLIGEKWITRAEFIKNCRSINRYNFPQADSTSSARRMQFNLPLVSAHWRTGGATYLSQYKH